MEISIETYDSPGRKVRRRAEAYLWSQPRGRLLKMRPALSGVADGQRRSALTALMRGADVTMLLATREGVVVGYMEINRAHLSPGLHEALCLTSAPGALHMLATSALSVYPHLGASLSSLSRARLLRPYLHTIALVEANTMIARAAREHGIHIPHKAPVFPIWQRDGLARAQIVLRVMGYGDKVNDLEACLAVEASRALRMFGVLPDTLYPEACRALERKGICPRPSDEQLRQIMAEWLGESAAIETVAA